MVQRNRRDVFKRSRSASTHVDNDSICLAMLLTLSFIFSAVGIIVTSLIGTSVSIGVYLQSINPTQNDENLTSDPFIILDVPIKTFTDSNAVNNEFADELDSNGKAQKCYSRSRDLLQEIMEEEEKFNDILDINGHAPKCPRIRNNDMLDVNGHAPKCPRIRTN